MEQPESVASRTSENLPQAAECKDENVTDTRRRILFHISIAIWLFECECIHSNFGHFATRRALYERDGLRWQTYSL